MLKIGLTGGIGSGKSLTCEYFSRLGIPVIDTDELARKAVIKGSETLDRLVREFGNTILLPDGSLDRSRLRAIVFGDQQKLELLESLVHPEIRKLLLHELSQLNAPYVIIAIPLLVEKSWQNAVDRILVVDCPVELQVQRALERDSDNEAGIRSIIDRQASREDRLMIADDVIRNDSDLDTLRHQVEQLHLYYTQLVSGR